VTAARTTNIGIFTVRRLTTGNVALAAEIEVAAETVFDVGHHLGEYGFGVRHCLADLLHPVIIVLFLVDLPRSVAARRPTNLH